MIIRYLDPWGKFQARTTRDPKTLNPYRSLYRTPIDPFKKNPKP